MSGTFGSAAITFNDGAPSEKIPLIKSDPYGELAVQTAKYVKNCTELHMAKKRIQKIADFEKFVNLEVLWLNDNQLRKIDSLDSNVRIKKLNVMNNSIETLEDSSLLKFKFLGEFID